MTKTEKKAVLTELDDLQTALKKIEMDAIVQHHPRNTALSLRVLPKVYECTTVTENIGRPCPELLEARKAMPSTVKVSENEYRATQHQCSAPFPGFQDDKPLRKILAEYFKEVR